LNLCKVDKLSKKRYAIGCKYTYLIEDNNIDIDIITIIFFVAITK
jgi:hypothetical protein